MKTLWWLLASAMLAQKLAKHWLVRRFFARPIPAPTREPELVSVLQPILSGDPTLRECLAANLAVQTRYPLEFIWLVDDDDATAHTICAELASVDSQHAVRIISSPPPTQHTNPKTVKLVVGLQHAHGDVVCVLDDDTRLPDWGLEHCLPFLDAPGVGLAFGLPYYRHFGNFWSSMISLFVNDQSLLTYVPYTALAEPFTINGMFYAMRREVLALVGGFRGLEAILADDFAVASRVRAHGYRLVQTPLRHAISTFVRGPRQYASLMQRWFIFPRESLLRHLKPHERAIVLGLGGLPALFPLALVGMLLKNRSPALLLYSGLYFGHSLLTYAEFNHAYLHDVTPSRYIWLIPLVETLLPLQLVAALVSPQRIVWRGHVMQVERGGNFRFVRRRDALSRSDQ